MRGWESSASFLFLLLTGLVAVYTVIQVVMFPLGLRTSPTGIEASNLKGFRMVELEALEKYREAFSTHALFSKPKAPTSIQPVSSLDEMLKPYVLTGIVQGIEPEALIQNTLTKQTHFVQVDEQFDQLKLVEIKEHSVIVEYAGEQKELHLDYV